MQMMTRSCLTPIESLTPKALGSLALDKLVWSGLSGAWGSPSSFAPSQTQYHDVDNVP